MNNTMNRLFGHSAMKKIYLLWGIVFMLSMLTSGCAKGRDVKEVAVPSRSAATVATEEDLPTIQASSISQSSISKDATYDEVIKFVYDATGDERLERIETVKETIKSDNPTTFSNRFYASPLFAVYIAEVFEMKAYEPVSDENFFVRFEELDAVVSFISEFFDDKYNNYEDGVALLTVMIKSDDPMAFSNRFPDPFFAVYAATLFDMNPTEAVSDDKLKTYTGEIALGPSFLGTSIEGVGYLTGVTSISSCKNEIRELPEDMSNLKNLKVINMLKSYDLEELPESIGECENLEEMNFTLTSLKALPKSIGDLKKLSVLYCGNTNITEIPEEIGGCESLESLLLDSLDLAYLPDSLCDLKNLKSLGISHNPNLTNLPDNIGNLTNLESLYMSECDIRQMPKSLKKCPLNDLVTWDNYNLDDDYTEWFPEGMISGYIPDKRND